MGFGAVAPRVRPGIGACARGNSGGIRTHFSQSVTSYLGSRITTARVLCVVCQSRVRHENARQPGTTTPYLVGAVLTNELQAEMPPASTTLVGTLVRSRWEPCLGTGVPLLVAIDRPQFRLDEAGNVLPIGGDAITFAGHTPTAGIGGGPPRSRVAATHTQAPRCVTEPSGCRPLCTATPPLHASTPRKRCLAPRALLPSPVSVTDDLAPMLVSPPVERPADCEGADALSAVLKLAEAVRCRLDC